MDKGKYYLDNKQRYADNREAYIKTLDGYFTKTYANQRANAIQRCHAVPDYSKQQLRDQYVNTNLFKRLWNNWVKSGYKKDLIPSFDRVDPKKSYTLYNIQLMVWKENEIKGHNENATVPVSQYSLDGLLCINQYKSIQHASNQTGIHYTNISMCSKGLRKTAGGYKWRRT